MKTLRRHLPVSAFYRFCFLPLLFLAGCDRQVSAPPVPAHPPLRLATMYWPGAYWIDVAREQDWFRAAGLAIQFKDTQADFVGSLEDVVAGRLDTQEFVLFDLMARNARGADLVMIVCTDQSFGGDGIVARAGIDTLAQLRGRRLGVPKDSYSDYIAVTVLQREGLAVGDFTRVDMQGEAAPAALAAGQIDAFITWEPFLSAPSAPGAHRLWDTSQVPGITPAGLTLRRAFIKERPADVQALVRVWQRATDFILQHPDEACAIVARVNKKTPAEVRTLLAQDQLLDLGANLAVFSYAVGFESLHGTARVINDFLLKQHLATTKLDSTDFLAPQFLKELK